MERAVRNDYSYKPIIFLSLDTPWANQQREDGIQRLQDAVANAIDFGAEVITIAGLGYTSLAQLFSRPQPPSLAEIRGVNQRLQNEVEEFLKS